MTKPKMRTLYLMTHPPRHPGDEPIVWRGDCAKWASRRRSNGVTLTTVRTAWVGPVWCDNGPNCQH